MLHLNVKKIVCPEFLFGSIKRQEGKKGSEAIYCLAKYKNNQILSEVKFLNWKIMQLKIWFFSRENTRFHVVGGEVGKDFPKN